MLSHLSVFSGNTRCFFYSTHPYKFSPSPGVVLYQSSAHNTDVIEPNISIYVHDMSIEIE